METNGRRDADTDQAETKLGDVVAGKAHDEEHEHQETLVVERSLEVGLGKVMLGPRSMGWAGTRLRDSPECCLIPVCQTR
jgi:hypothetical protein